jgi:hypothetical protein
MRVAVTSFVWAEAQKALLGRGVPALVQILHAADALRRCRLLDMGYT